MVYELIDDAGADGIWARILKHRLNMHDSVLKQCIKYLETKGYIRHMKSVENIGKKMYIKATLRPSDRATGGPWYTDSTLDEAFIDQLLRVVFETIRNRSSYLSRHGGGSAARTTSSGAATKTAQEGRHSGRDNRHSRRSRHCGCGRGGRGAGHRGHSAGQEAKRRSPVDGRP